MFIFKCGIKDKLFMLDNFKGEKKTNKLFVRNWLKSNTLAYALSTNLTYTKENNVHVAK